MFFKKNKNSISSNIKQNDLNDLQLENNNVFYPTLNEIGLKGNYVLVSDDFSVNQLKPFQKLVMIKEKNQIRKAVVDYSISLPDLNKIKNSQNDKVKSYEISSNRPFRLISQNDINLAKSNITNTNIKGPFDNYLLNESTSIESAKYINFNDIILPKKNDIEEVENKKIFNNEEDLENNNLNLEDESFDWDEFDFNPINDDCFFKNKDKLIHDNSKPIVLRVQSSESVIYPFKIRELNQNWNNLDYSDLYNTSSSSNIKLGLMDEYLGTVNLNKGLKQKNPIFSRKGGLFFKVIYDSYNEKKIEKQEKTFTFYKNKYNSNFEKFKSKSNNNLTIVRRKIDKKLLKEKEIKGYL